MVTENEVKEFALQFNSAELAPHFEKISIRVKKKIFLTIDSKRNRVCVKFTPEQQDIYSIYDNSVIYPATGAWGKQGWTFIELKKIKKRMLFDAVKDSYLNVAPAKLKQLLLK